MPESLHEVALKVNGVPHQVAVPARRLLSDCLRHDIGLTGTHVGCEHGVCGACTVLLDGDPVRSCLLLANLIPLFTIPTRYSRFPFTIRRSCWPPP